MGTIGKAAAVGQLSARLAAWGYEVCEVDDVAQIPAMIERVGKSYLTPLSNPQHNDFTARNALWLVAKKNGEPVFLGCARLEDLGDESVGRYWGRTLKRAYGDVTGGEVIEKIRPEIEKTVGGRLVYFGDLYVAAAERGSRVALRAFVALGHLAVSLKWDPDWVYCFLRERDVLRGAAQLYSFASVMPNPFRWLRPVPPRSNSEWLALLPKSEVWPYAAAAVEAVERSAGPRREPLDNPQGEIQDAPIPEGVGNG